MANVVLNSLLRDYERKRVAAELDLEKRRETLYALLPDLAKIDDELNSFALDTTKCILLNKKGHSLTELRKKIRTLKKQKKDILTSNGYSASYLKPSYECKICNDTGFVDSDFGKVMCNCLEQRLINASYDNSNMFNLKNQCFEKFNAKLFSDEVDFEKYGQKISPRDNILNIKDKALFFVEHFDDPSVKNLLFIGSPGLGKSFMSGCIANELIKKNKSVFYQTAPILLDSIIDYKMSRNKDLSDNIYKTVLEADLLIIDDLGSESLNSMKLSELFTILNARIMNVNNKVTKTIISTNSDLIDIFDRYDERIGSRFAGSYDIYRFFGNDLRFAGKK